MLLAIDVGNTSTVFGLYDGADLTDHWRIATERHKSGDELGALYRSFLDVGRVEGIALSSTVPQLGRSYQEFAKRYASAPLLELGPGVKTGIPVRYDDPREVGPDRIANAVAAKARYGVPVIVVDFGTSTNFDVVSAEGEYVGGVLAPGIEISMDALFARAARLFSVDFAAAAVGSRQRLAVSVAAPAFPRGEHEVRRGVGAAPVRRATAQLPAADDAVRGVVRLAAPADLVGG